MCAKIVVTGGAGTCGAVCIDRLLDDDNFEEVWSVDNNEGALFFQKEHYKNSRKYRAAMIDIRDTANLKFAFSEADAVIHCAAYKNVPMCEISPSSCVSTNINGTENIINAGISQNVKTVIFTSSDKAVNPTNIMGATKFVGEKLVVAANLMARGVSDTRFAATRFGNVVGSTGSVLPVFIDQLKSGRPLTVTDTLMSRFMMSQKSAAELVIDSMKSARGGELFITKMPTINMDVFARAIFELSQCEGIISKDLNYEDSVNYIGARPGEKMYEELMSDEELGRAKETDAYFVVLPPDFEVYGNMEVRNKYQSCKKPERTYNSNDEQALTLNETIAFIRSVLDDDGVNLRAMS